jgi:hypothetical protein
VSSTALALPTESWNRKNTVAIATQKNRFTIVLLK